MSDYTLTPDDQLTTGAHISYWTDSLAPLHYKPLKSNASADVVVVGGGIAGVSIAYNLCKAGLHVILLEDGYIGSGETGRTSAHLVNALDNRYYTFEKIFGKEETRMIAQSHTAAIEFIENNCRNEAIHCEFERVPGYLFLHPSDEDASLEKELEAAGQAGIAVSMTDKIPGLQGNTKGLMFPDQAQFHPLKYVFGLCAAIIKKGGEIYTSTHVKEVKEDHVVTADGYTVLARHIVIATNSPINDLYKMHLKQFAYRTYLIGAEIPKDSLPKALWWDTGDYEINKHMPPYHYVRVQKYNEEKDLLLCGGEDHPTGIHDGTLEEEHYKKVEAWMDSHFPHGDIVYRWSGQVLEPMDGLAFIGRNPMNDNIYIATGDSGNGLTHAGVAAILITDLIQKKENPWEQLYDPARLKFIKTASLWFSEFIGGMIKYLKENPRHPAKTEINSIKKGEGKIIEIEKKKYAAYRDANNKMHFVTAKCTHLGCIVKWNNDEKSWDCPCHGSRFSIEGKVLNGPAYEELEYTTHPDEADL